MILGPFLVLPLALASGVAPPPSIPTSSPKPEIEQRPALPRPSAPPATEFVTHPPPPPPPPPPRWCDGCGFALAFEFERSADGRIAGCRVERYKVNVSPLEPAECDAARLTAPLRALALARRPGEPMRFVVRRNNEFWRIDNSPRFDPSAVAEPLMAGPRYGTDGCAVRVQGDARIAALAGSDVCQPWVAGRTPDPTPILRSSLVLYAGPADDPDGPTLERTRAPASPPYPPVPPSPPPPPPPPPPPRARESFRVQYDFDRAADGRVENCTVAIVASDGLPDGRSACSEHHVAPDLQRISESYRPGEAMSLRIRWDILPWTDGMTLAVDPAAVAQFVAAGRSDLKGNDGCVQRLAGDTRLLANFVSAAHCTSWTSDTVIAASTEALVSVAIYASSLGRVGDARTPRHPAAATMSQSPTRPAQASDPRAAEDGMPAMDDGPMGTGDDLPDRFVVTNSATRTADGTLIDCEFVGMPSADACDVFTSGDDGPALFARTHRPGETLRLTLVVDVRPWTGTVQPVPVAGQVEQVVLLGGEDDTETCARLGQGGPVMRAWDEVTACAPTDDSAAFFVALGDPRPRQSTWTLAAEPIPL